MNPPQTLIYRLKSNLTGEVFWILITFIGTFTYIGISAHIASSVEYVDSNIKEKEEIFNISENKHELIYLIGNSWEYKSTHAPHENYPTEYCRSEVVGDTLINDTTAYIVHTSHQTYPELGVTTEYIFEDSGKTYFYEEKLGRFILESDFDVQEGDILEARYYNGFYDEDWNFPEYFQVARILYPTLCGQRRRCLVVTYEGSDRIFDYWIEGIGSVMYKSLVLFTYTPNLTTELQEFYRNGELIFEINEFKQAMGLDGVDDLYADSPDIEKSQEIYDLMGNKISTPTKGSIYILRGRKIIW